MINTCFKLFDLTPASNDWGVAADWLDDHNHYLAQLFRTRKYCLFNPLDQVYVPAERQGADSGNGSGQGSGAGSGGASSGNGRGSGSGSGSGTGSGFGDGSGTGNGFGCGSGYGDGSGTGHGFGQVNE